MFGMFRVFSVFMEYCIISHVLTYVLCYLIRFVINEDWKKSVLVARKRARLFATSC